ncbi:MAG: penicillin-binding protein, partial [Crocinitomicaceae bacterium]|nr:penicillin-binding protein [Crocinitomicaceae bacterium]
KLVTGVWVGAEDRIVRFRSMEWGQGGRMALPIFGYYMQRAFRDKALDENEQFRQPSDYDPSMFGCTDAPVPEVVNEAEIPFEF